jgi:hypothetical protein
MYCQLPIRCRWKYCPSNSLLVRHIFLQKSPFYGSQRTYWRQVMTCHVNYVDHDILLWHLHSTILTWVRRFRLTKFPVVVSKVGCRQPAAPCELQQLSFPPVFQQRQFVGRFCSRHKSLPGRNRHLAALVHRRHAAI